METTGAPTDLIATVADCRHAGDLYLSVIRLMHDIEERGKLLPDGTRGVAFLGWLRRLEPQYGDAFVESRDRGEVVVGRYIAAKLNISETEVDEGLARMTLLQMCSSGVIPGDEGDDC